MDLSKLPKLSQTPAPPAAAAPESTPTAPPSPDTITPQAVELFCHCGAPIVAGTKFCAHCGASYRDVLRGSGGGETRRVAPEERDGPAGFWVEAFFGIAMGLFLMLMAPNGIKAILAGLSGKPFTPYLHPAEPGVWVDYTQWENQATGAVTQIRYADRFDHYWSDRAITFFALSLILNGIVLAVLRKPWAVLACALLILGATLFNVWYVVASYSRISPINGQPYGLPMLSALAVILGVVTVGYQFITFNEMRRARA